MIKINPIRLDDIPDLENIVRRFWKKVVKKDTGCWEWQGKPNRNGYGTFAYGIRGQCVRVLAHRFAYAVTFGAIRDDRLACHRCDNPSCVRPDHLFEGTHADNQQDMAQKGRGGPKNAARGSKASNVKLEEPQVLEIYRRAKAGESHRALGREFNVRHSTVGRIARGEIWSHVTQLKEAA